MTGMVMKKNIWWRWASTHNCNGDEEKYLVEMGKHT
jgi:hypothetical protein